NQFTLDDFRKQLRTIRKMGPLESVLGMIPGMSSVKQLAENKPDEKQLGRVEAIINSMTAKERRDESLLNGSRRKRIAKGSGTTVEDVNRLVKQFGEMRRVRQMMGGMQALQQGGKKVAPTAQQMQQLQQMRKGGGGLPG